MSQRQSPLRAFAGRYAIAFGVAAALMVSAVVGVNYVINQKLNNVRRVAVKTAPAPPQGANYLLIGSDTRAFVKNAAEKQAFGSGADTQGQRSDTIMVIHVEPNQKRTLAVSFPRDLWVNVPGQGMAKINSAFNTSPDKLVETLKANFNIDINHYLEVDFKSFQGIVDAIGTVPVYFPYAAKDEKTGLQVGLPGCAQLHGQSALEYVRSRDLQYLSVSQHKFVNADLIPDIDRIARQQAFIRELAGIAVSKGLNNPLTANEIADRVLENLTIDKNLSKDDIFSLIDALRTVNPNDTSALEFQTLPWQEGPPAGGGQSVLYPKTPDWKIISARLADFSGAPAAPTVQPSQVTLTTTDATGVSGTAAGASKEFRRLGFKTLGVGKQPAKTSAHTVVHYAPGAVDKGKLVLEYIDPNARLLEDKTLKGTDVSVVLGIDFKSIIIPLTATTTTPTTPTTLGTATPGSTTPTTAAPANGGTQTTSGDTPAPIANQSVLGTPAPRVAPC